MAISDEMKQELESLIENAEIVKAMFKEQDSVDYEIGDYDEPITQMLSHMTVSYTHLTLPTISSV